jgi:hypothetical protein
VTRPVPWRRSSIVERRRHRREFQEIKAAVDASPSMQAYRQVNRQQAAAQEARQKVYRARAGDPTVRKLTPRQWAALNPERQQEAMALGLVRTPEEQAAYDQDLQRQAELRRIAETYADR